MTTAQHPDAPLSPGTPAPGFTAVSATGEEFTLAQFAGKWVVLAFYPADFTGG
jgi:peroxiredoxin